MTPRDASHPLELLSAYLDGRTSDAERAFVEAHLAACPSCRESLEDLRLLAEALPSVAAPPVPDDLASRISSRVAAEAAPGRVVSFRRRFGIPLSAAATIAAVALVAGVFWRRESPRVPEPAIPAPSETPRTLKGAAPPPPPPPPPSPAPKRERRAASERVEEGRDQVPAAAAPVEPAPGRPDAVGGVPGGVVGGVVGGVPGGAESDEAARSAAAACPDAVEVASVVRWEVSAARDALAALERLAADLGGSLSHVAGSSEASLDVPAARGSDAVRRLTEAGAVLRVTPAAPDATGIGCVRIAVAWQVAPPLPPP